VTEAFNRNILNSVNDLIRSDFKPADFDHLAFFNEEESRMEMHLVARKDLVVHSKHFSGDLVFERGDTIHTENSHKYSEGHIQKLAESSGLELVHTHRDEQGWFALSEFQK
jgi:L-histidine N-alpha-methyltransferase